MEDIDGRFWNMTLQPLVDCFGEKIGNEGSDLPLNQTHPYFLKSFWVNYQKKHEFNPIHKHTGVYSFVIWLKIPFSWEDQNRDNITNTPTKSCFEFSYNNILGESSSYTYRTSTINEGTLLFFPSEYLNDKFSILILLLNFIFFAIILLLIVLFFKLTKKSSS